MFSTDLSLEFAGNGQVSDNDLRLVMGVRARSEAAFSELHRLYSNRLYRTIFSITKNHADTEDVLQDTLMRAYLALDSFEGRSKLLSWLTRIAVNSSLMAPRKRRVRYEASLDSLPSSEDEILQLQVKDPGLNPEEACLQLENGLQLERAIAGLKPALRTVVQIQMSQECSMKETAQSLNLSVATVKARLHRARQRISKRMQSKARMNPPRTSTSNQRLQ
jgi:RNA polymerase sigma-70 factor (ECF subfamily)